MTKSLHLREQLRKRYAAFPAFPTEPDAVVEQVFDVPLEDAFLKKIRETVSAKLTDPRFGVAELCREMGLSASTLSRKLEALTEQTPVAILRSARLAHARSLLLEKRELTIAEVAFASGFEDPAYFTRVFSKEFGLPPSEFREK